ncbi:hypothetical protein GCM10010420_36490 [Streptomyces glaucosporus]|uniref:Nucleoside 2-deoxyribosyltransferase n=1 Tax=Streptomyces glaucosporus TaxID=284044 RepID=A0ABN3IHW3_9ACTN
MTPDASLRTAQRPMRVLLGGPIKAGFRDGTDFDARLRLYVDRLLTGLRATGMVIDSAHEAEGFSRLPEGTVHAAVVRRDHQWLTGCDAYACLLPLRDGTVYPSIGTGVELGWATARGIPVIALVEVARMAAYSPFLRGLGSMFDVTLIDIDEAVADPAGFADAIAAAVGTSVRARGAR